MKIYTANAGWSIGLERHGEAEALLQAHRSPAYERAMFRNERGFGREEIARQVGARLTAVVAKGVLPAAFPIEGMDIKFPHPQTQYVSNLIYAAVAVVRESPDSVTDDDGLIVALSARLSEFFATGKADGHIDGIIEA